ncbi:MAG TPA: trypsin-like peptidase domain-containing protein [Baekduia sp.]|nr:trypsin-like peptidase domain-containing protein [Baekduia sp.]
MKFPRHLWTGEWRLESEQAREAAEEEAARRRAALAAAERERAAAGETAGAPPRSIRVRTVAAVAVVAAAIAGGAFAAGALLHDDPKVQPLPAVSGKPVAPDKGQSRAGKIYAQASPAVVSIRTDVGSGTGFLIDRKGTLVTNAHVVGTASRVVVKFGPDGRSIDGEVKGSDASSDLAVVTIDPGSAPRNAKPLQFADSRQIRVGDTAIAIGNPFGLDRTATEGIVSGIGRSIKAPNGFSIDEVIQTDAPINPGNSGGPLLDETGRVMGINSQIATAGGTSQGNVGIGFAVPSNTVREVVPRLEKGDRIARLYLGVETTDPTDPNAPAGAEITSVVPGGPADSAGLNAGDVITELGGDAVTSSSDVSRIVAAKQPGDQVDVRVDRSGQDVTLNVTLQNRPAHTP